uniref:Utp12 domain-containing protein n=1 Tax=Panagrellus redivivus TaxID=6233 RepID=A0A7E4V765_PANRE
MSARVTRSRASITPKPKVNGRSKRDSEQSLPNEPKTPAKEINGNKPIENGINGVAAAEKEEAPAAPVVNGVSGSLEKSEAFKELASTATGTSFVVLLSQGILSGDEEKIASVVTNSDPATVMATVKDLPVVHVIPFLNILEQTFRREKIRKPHVWMNWVQAVLSIHMGYLSSVKDLDQKLGSLSDWLKKRVSHLDKLISLNGKLEMITEQMERRTKPTFFAQQQPLFILNDDDKIDSDVDEVLFEYPDDENDEWWGSDDADDDGGASSEEERKPKKPKKSKKRPAENGTPNGFGQAEDSDEEMEY